MNIKQKVKWKLQQMIINFFSNQTLLELIALAASLKQVVISSVVRGIRAMSYEKLGCMNNDF